jgi:hypothetical protein
MAVLLATDPLARSPPDSVTVAARVGAERHSGGRCRRAAGFGGAQQHQQTPGDTAIWLLHRA